MLPGCFWTAGPCTIVTRTGTLRFCEFVRVWLVMFCRAYLMIPNITVHPSFGKLLFSACDLLTGYMLERTLDTPALWLPCLWLFNPFVMSISARGNADCLICFLVVGTVYYLKRGALCMSAILLV